MSESKDNGKNLFAYLPKSRSVIQITSSKNAKKDLGKATLNSVNYAKLGDDDKLADDIIATVWENDFMPSLLETAVQFLVGGGLQLYRKRIVPGTDQMPAKEIIEPAQNPMMEDWAEKVFLQDYFEKAAYQLVYGGNIYTGIYLNRLKNVAKLQIFDFPVVRSEYRDPESGRIKNYLVFTKLNKQGKVEDFDLIPRYYDTIEQVKDLFIFHAKAPVPGHQYYSYPIFFGALKSLKLLNSIPEFHLSGLNNGYNVKYHVKIPANWLDQFATQEEKDKAWAKLREDMDEQLSGKENVNKVILSKFFIDNVTGKPLPGFDIVAIDSNQNDKAYLDLSKDMRVNASSSVAIHPGLANVDTGGKLGGTASEMRVAADLHRTLRTPAPRRLLLRAIEVAKKINGFPADHFWYPKDIELTTLDNNPTGRQAVVANATV